MITRKVILVILIMILVIHFINPLYFVKYMHNDKIKNYVNRLKNDIVAEVRPSKINGVGLFALRNIYPNKIVFKDIEKNEFIVEQKILEENLPKYQLQYIDKMFDYSKNGPYMSKNINNIPITSFINHSNSPNILYNEDKKYWYSIKLIAKNQEILTDYHTINEDREIL